MHCPCGASATPIEGMVHVMADGSRVQECSCAAGHRFGVKQLVQQGPCPACGHVWAVEARGGNPDGEPMAAPENVMGGDLNSLSRQAGLGDCMRY